MPKYKIHRSVGWIVNSQDEDTVECETLEEAEQWAHDWALEDLYSGAEEVEE